MFPPKLCEQFVDATGDRRSLSVPGSLSRMLVKISASCVASKVASDRRFASTKLRDRSKLLWESTQE